MPYPTVRVRFWGPEALCSQPHFRTDPISYPVLTPSAAKGCMKSIWGKPEADWEIERITICRPIRWHTSRSTSVVAGNSPDAPVGTQIMTSTKLLDVEYVVEARLVANPLRTTETSREYMQRVLRRMRGCQQARQPFFGHTECIAYWELLEPNDPGPDPIPIDLDIGPMLFDLRPIDMKKDLWMPIFFRASIVAGILEVPKALYDREREILQTAKAMGRTTPRRSTPKS